MAAPFPEAQIAPLIYMFLGATIALLGFSGWYIRRLHLRLDSKPKKDEKTGLRVDNIGLSKRSEEVLEKVLEDAEYQSDLPAELNKSKATVSQAIKELFERNLVKKRKKANTYLIEPKEDEIKDLQR